MIKHDAMTEIRENMLEQRRRHGMLVRYGDVIQLWHPYSRQFLHSSASAKARTNSAALKIGFCSSSVRPWKHSPVLLYTNDVASPGSWHIAAPMVARSPFFQPSQHDHLVLLQHIKKIKLAGFMRSLTFWSPGYVAFGMPCLH